MLTKDYLMRMIDTLVKALAKLVFLKDAKDYKTALSELNNVTKEFFGLDLNFVDNISDEQLINLIGKNELLLPGNCYVFGVLFYEEAEIFKVCAGRFQGAERRQFFFVFPPVFLTKVFPVGYSTISFFEN